MNNKELAIDVFKHPLIQEILKQKLAESSVVNRLIVEEVLSELDEPKNTLDQNEFNQLLDLLKSGTAFEKIISNYGGQLSDEQIEVLKKVAQGSSGAETSDEPSGLASAISTWIKGKIAERAAPVLSKFIARIPVVGWMSGAAELLGVSAEEEVVKRLLFPVDYMVDAMWTATGADEAEAVTKEVLGKEAYSQILAAGTDKTQIGAVLAGLDYKQTMQNFVKVAQNSSNSTVKDKFKELQNMEIKGFAIGKYVLESILGEQLPELEDTPPEETDSDTDPADVTTTGGDGVTDDEENDNTDTEPEVTGAGVSDDEENDNTDTDTDTEILPVDPTTPTSTVDSEENLEVDEETEEAEVSGAENTASAEEDFSDGSPNVTAEAYEEAIYNEMDRFYGQGDKPSFMKQIFLSAQGDLLRRLIGSLNKIISGQIEGGDPEERAAFTDATRARSARSKEEPKSEPEKREDLEEGVRDVIKKGKDAFKKGYTDKLGDIETNINKMKRKAQGEDAVVEEFEFSRNEKVTLKRELSALADLLTRTKRIANDYKKYATRSSATKRFDGTTLEKSMNTILGHVQVHIARLVHEMIKIHQAHVAEAEEGVELQEVVDGDVERKEKIRNVSEFFNKTGNLYLKSLKPSMEAGEEEKAKKVAQEMRDYAKEIVPYFPKSRITSEGEIISLDDAIENLEAKIKQFSKVLRDIFMTVKDQAVSPEQISDATIALESLANSIANDFNVPSKISRKDKEALKDINPEQETLSDEDAEEEVMPATVSWDDDKIKDWYEDILNDDQRKSIQEFLDQYNRNLLQEGLAAVFKHEVIDIATAKIALKAMSPLYVQTFKNLAINYSEKLRDYLAANLNNPAVVQDDFEDPDLFADIEQFLNEKAVLYKSLIPFVDGKVGKEKIEFNENIKSDLEDLQSAFKEIKQIYINLANALKDDDTENLKMLANKFVDKYDILANTPPEEGWESFELDRSLDFPDEDTPSKEEEEVFEPASGDDLEDALDFDSEEEVPGGEDKEPAPSEDGWNAMEDLEDDFVNFAAEWFSSKELKPVVAKLFSLFSGSVISEQVDKGGVSKDWLAGLLNLFDISKESFDKEFPYGTEDRNFIRKILAKFPLREWIIKEMVLNSRINKLVQSGEVDPADIGTIRRGFADATKDLKLDQYESDVSQIPKAIEVWVEDAPEDFWGVDSKARQFLQAMFLGKEQRDESSSLGDLEERLIEKLTPIITQILKEQ